MQAQLTECTWQEWSAFNTTHGKVNSGNVSVLLHLAQNAYFSKHLLGLKSHYFISNTL